MKSRHRMSRNASKKSFKRNAGHHPVNNPRPMRGGFRI